jgi:ParB-like chromosome segregation protein Spo0J
MEGAAMLTTVGTEPVSLEDLEPFPGNARRGDVDMILGSLRANGQYKPLTVRRKGDAMTILAGNHTFLALLRHEEDDRAGCADWELSHDRPCQLCIAVDKDDPTALAHLIECDDATATRINLVDNRVADVGDYDQAALAALLAVLEDDLVGTGYAVSEADLFTAGEDTADEPLPADRLPEPGDAEVSHAEPTWGVVVRCANETQQTTLLEKLIAEGLDVRALSVM